MRSKGRGAKTRARTVATAIKPAEVRAAREFLRKRGVRGVSPRKFALSAQETGLNFRQLLEFLQGVRKKHENGRT
jgi:hypothetical protein